jgi:hypothetical protein
LDERKVKHSHEQQYGNNHQADDDLRKFAPDTKIHFHPRTLTPQNTEAKRILLS